jgi:multiple sugar transport system permease protein
MSKKTQGGQGLDNEAIAAWLFLAPASILMAIFILWPVAYLFYLSFTRGSFTRGGMEWIGLANYQRLLTSPDFWQVIGNTIYFTAGTVVPSLIIPLILAVLLNRALALRGLLRTAYFIPSITSLVAVGLGWRWLFQNNGPVNDLLIAIGWEPVSWLNSTVWAMPVLILLTIWKQLGFNMVIFLAGLQAIPQNRYEAAELDGADGLQKFWHVTLPGLRPTIIFVAIATVIFTLKSFEQVYVITSGGPLNSTNLLVFYTYEQAFAQFEFGYAAAATTVLMAVTLVLVYLQLNLFKED